MNKNIIIGLVALVVLGGGAVIAVKQSENTMQANTNRVSPNEDEAMRMEKEKTEAAAMEKEKMAKEGEVMSKGIYTNYDQAKLANAEKGDVVLFFHAPWCPTCKEADKNFSTSSTPDDLTLLKTDYDSSQDLKKKYGVTYQHTFVQVDKDGNLIKKWSGSNNYDAIAKELN